MSQVSLSNEAVQTIVNTAQAAVKAADRFAVHHLDNEHTVFVEVLPGGAVKATTIENNIPPINATLYSVREIPAAVERFGGEKTVIWYSKQGVGISVDPSGSFDTLRYVFGYDLQFQELLSLAGTPRPMDPKALRRWLRVKMAGAADCQTLLNWLCNCSFAAGSKTRIEQQQGKVSIGRDVLEAAESDSGPAPETIRFSIPVFADPALRARREIKAAIEIDAGTGTIEICPNPSDLQKAIDDELENIASFLAGAIPDKAILYGQP